ncbi:MAG TPA: hypothetical protein VKD72_07300 [Gemmataceae bacterium]|nr:hypothetical protein [Gemmataceae bacterium]
MPRRPDPVTARLWQQRLQRFAHAERSVADFCDQEGISPASFYSWKRRLNAPSRSPAAEQNLDTQPGPRWLPVRLPTAVAAVELVLPSGVVLRVPPGSDLAFVRSLMESLGQLPC